MNSDSELLVRRDGVNSYRYLIPALAVWTSSFSMGTCYGYSAPAKSSMLSMDEFPITEYEFHWLASILTLGGLIGGLTGGTFSERIGRRWTLINASLGLIAGWQTIVCSSNISHLLIGRALCGYCIGVMSLVGPVYLSEVSPAAVRGRLSAAIQLCIVSGLLSMYVVASYLTWKWLAIFAMAFACITVVLLLFSVESPSWYFHREQHSQATKSLLFLWGDCDQVTNEILRNERPSSGPIVSDFSVASGYSQDDIGVVKPIMLSVLLMVAQQGCGINAVVFYAEDIFHKAGSSLSAYSCMVAFGIGQVLGSLVNIPLIDHFGRRALLIGSSFFVIISLYTMTIYFIYLMKLGTYGWVPITALSIYTVAFAVGLGPVAWVMMGEMLPKKCRSYGSVISTSVNWAGAFLITNQWANMQAQMTIPGAYAFLATLSLVLMVVFVKYLPETKGKSLSEIESYFVKLRRIDVLDVGGTIDDSVA